MGKKIMNRNANTPIIDALESFVSGELTAMHMPGHKQGKGFDADFTDKIVKFDLTELPGLDNFHRSEGVILESSKLMAETFGAEKSWFLVNGSTSGIHAAFLSCFRRGDKILVNRNCHISVIHALLLFGISPVFVMPGYSEEYNLSLPPDLSSWKRALDENPDAKGALVTTPDYFGICQPLRELADFLHEKGKILLVDEAHGAHFVFSEKLPETALEQGADLCVQSFHKTLPALTQAAVLHVGSSRRINPERVKRAISMITTTSPSYIIMASMDYARAFGWREGSKVYAGLIAMLDEMKEKLTALKKLRLVPDIINGLKRDPLRIVVDTSLSDITGYELYNMLLKEYGIAAEMCDAVHVVFIVTAADTPEDLNRVARALLETDERINEAKGKVSFSIPLNSGCCTIPELWDFLDSSEEILLSEAEGYTCADAVTPYPPGIPVLCPGEIIARKHIDYLTGLIGLGAEIHGLTDDQNGSKRIRVIKGL